MVLDALRGYVQLASGLTEVSRQRAVTEAKALLTQGGALEQLVSGQAKGIADDLGRQAQALADDIVATSKANRQVLVTLIRAEAERAVGSLGLATADEIASLRRKVEQLDRSVNGGTASTSSETAKRSPTRKAAAKKASTNKSPTNKSTTNKSTGTKATAKKSASTTSATKKSGSASKATAKSAAKKTTRTTKKGTP